MLPWTYVLVAAGTIMLGAAGVNEMTHGGMAEGIGLGHHHMADYGGYHCTDPASDDWPRHVEHMHNGTAGRHCGDGHMAAGPHGGMMA